MSDRLLRAALWYAGRGWRVHPLRPLDKLPLLRGWPDQATTDPDTIRRWWGDTPDANVGIACGPGSGLLVLDADTADALAGLPGAIPEGPTVRTARGAHNYMGHPAGDTPTTRSHLWPGVDTRGRGGYIVAPPSIHPSGHVYEWTVRPTVALPTPPDWLLDRLTPPPPPPPRREVEFSDAGGGSRYAAAALRREVEAVAKAGPGTRNATLNAAAYSLGTLAGAGLIDPVVVAEALCRAGLSAGLTAREVERTVASGLRAGAANPREVSHV